MSYTSHGSFSVVAIYLNNVIFHCNAQKTKVQTATIAVFLDYLDVPQDRHRIW